MKDRQDLPELAKAYLFTLKIQFDNVLPDKAEEFNELANNLSARCRKIRFLKENTSDVFTIVEISFDDKSFRMTIDHYSSKMNLVYSEKFFDCKAVYVEEFAYDKFDTNQDRLVKTIGVKCKRGH